MPQATAATPARTMSQAPSTHAWPSGVAIRTKTRAARPAATRATPVGRCCTAALSPRGEWSNPPILREMEESGSIYAAGRVRLTELVTEADPEGRTVPVPGCPHWAVKDVVAHVTGVCADVLAGNLDGVTTEPWTAAQVGQRRD